MPEPTQQSLEEAMNAAGFIHIPVICEKSIVSHALTLDQLHNRKPPVDPMALVLADVLEAWGRPSDANVIRRDGPDKHYDHAAIAVLREAIEDATRPVDDEVLWVANPGWISAAPFVKRLRSTGFQIIRSPAPEVGK